MTGPGTRQLQRACRNLRERGVLDTEQPAVENAAFVDTEQPAVESAAFVDTEQPAVENAGAQNPAHLWE